jgi:hypothetical protein
MGFWGIGAFENDAAADFAAEVADKKQPSRVRSKLHQVLKARNGDLEDWPAAEGVAAAEIVAAARGYPPAKFDEALLRWASKCKTAGSDSLAELATKAVERIKTDSDLAESIGEGRNARRWKTMLQELQQRLAKPARELALKPILVERTPADERKAKAILKKKGVLFAKKGKWNVCVSYPSKQAHRLRDSDLVHFGSINELSILKLGGQQAFTDRGFAALSALRGLVELEVAGPLLARKSYEVPQISEKSANVFAEFRKLQFLTIRGTACGDEVAEALSGITSLRDIDMSQTAITDVGAISLRKCKRLQYLHLSKTAITDRTLAALGSLTSLRGLWLSSTAVTSAGVKCLAKLAQLNALNLHSTAVDDAACATIGKLTRLTNLNLSKTKVTSAGLKKLNGLSRLVQIQLDGLSLTDKDLPILKAFSKRTNLIMDGAKLSDSTVAELRSTGRHVFVGFDL